MATTLDRLDAATEWTPWAPTKEQPWSAKWAAHLYRRAGFGASRAELAQAVKAGLEPTLESFFAGSREAVERPPSIKSPPPINPANSLPDATPHAPIIRSVWVQRMLDGLSPLREKMALFWHNHFATGLPKVNDARLMEAQGHLLFRHALGDFRELIRQISRDPAMLVWLDSNQNVKARPNENYAREVMELFTLGVGNYTERDVREAARAFTGWHTAREKFTFVANEHDTGPKTVLGKTGPWGGDDVLKILLDQPVCAMFLVRKLYQFLINETVRPPDPLLAPLAKAFRESNYDIAVPVRTMLRSRHFFSEHAYRKKVKWPIEYVIGIVRAVGGGITGRIAVNPYSLLGALELMGQQLYAPPNVKGWEAGRAWLNTATVLARHNFAYSFVNGMGDLNESAKRYNVQAFFPAVNPMAMMLRQQIKEPAKVVEHFAEVLSPGDVRPEVSRKLVAHIGEADRESEVFLQRCRDVLFVLLTLPEYQLN